MPLHTNNASISLAFVPNPSSGLPKLTCSQGSISERELERWNEELRQNYEVLSAGSRTKTFEFKTPLRNLPRRYEVTVGRTDFSGMPKLRLTSLSTASDSNDTRVRAYGTVSAASPQESMAESTKFASESSASVTSSAQHRVDPAITFGHNFSEALEELQAGIPQNAEQRFGITQVLKDMRELSRERPLDFLLVLTGGYLQIARRFGSDDQRDLAYLAASHLIDELCCIRLEDLERDAVEQEQPLYARNCRRLWQTIMEN